MEVSFSFKYEEENELRVSLSSFVKESLGEELSSKLGDIDLVDVTLYRQAGDSKATWRILNDIVEQLGKVLVENSHSIFYYYCDEITPIPNMRNSHNLTPAEYRNKLFSILFQKGVALIPEAVFVDDLITIITDKGTAYIHLIYNSDLSEKATLVKDEINSLAQK